MGIDLHLGELIGGHGESIASVVALLGIGLAVLLVRKRPWRDWLSGPGPVWRR